MKTKEDDALLSFSFHLTLFAAFAKITPFYPPKANT